MIRRTSLEAYRRIHESNLLPAAKLAVYAHLFHHGPATRNEIDRDLAGGRPNPTYSRRLAEMERMGVLARVGERTCTVTGFKAELWDVTDGLPRKLPPRVKAAPRMFLRLPAFDSVDDAVAWCAERGIKVAPKLHGAQSAPVVGVVELVNDEAA